MRALLTLARGTSVVVENVFENRMSHAAELNRMGADIQVSGRVAVVRGVEALTGARVHTRDLRAGAALCIAALAAEGESIVENVALIDRGYDRLEEKLAAAEDDRAREETLWRGVADLLYGVFSAANLPDYAKEQLGARYAALLAVASPEEGTDAGTGV